MKRFLTCLWLAIVWGVVTGGGIGTAHAQFSDELKKLFLDIRPEFEADIQRKIDRAIADKTDRIRFTTDEFDRFRKNPVNPFEGLEEIDLKSLNGSIELKFEIPTVRNRRVGEWERQNPQILQPLTLAVAGTATSVVEVFADDQLVCLGVIVDANGAVLTKASEVLGKKVVRIRDFQKIMYSAKIGRMDEANDLVLLETPATGMRPLSFSDRQPNLGEFLVSAGSCGQAAALGCYSHVPRCLEESEKGFLGVTPRTASQGVELVEVTPGGAAESGGLRVGDVITKANELPMVDVTQLVTEVQRAKAGDKIKFDFLRGGLSLSTEVTLAGRSLSSDRAARFKMMNRLGAIPSERASDFPWVFQHDTPLFPEQCGGPILDLQGQVLGINIARQGRVASLAIPSAHVKTLLNQLQRETVAARQ